MQERLVLDCAGSLCPRKLPGVSRLGLGEAGCYNDGVVRPGTAGLLTGVEYSRVGSSTWICPTSLVSTRIGVELVEVQGNYPTYSE